MNNNYRPFARYFVTKHERDEYNDSDFYYHTKKDLVATKKLRALLRIQDIALPDNLIIISSNILFQYQFELEELAKQIVRNYSHDYDLFYTALEILNISKIFLHDLFREKLLAYMPLDLFFEEVTLP